MPKLRRQQHLEPHTLLLKKPVVQQRPHHRLHPVHVTRDQRRLIHAIDHHHEPRVPQRPHRPTKPLKHRKPRLRPIPARDPATHITVHLRQRPRKRQVPAPRRRDLLTKPTPELPHRQHVLRQIRQQQQHIQPRRPQQREIEPLALPHRRVRLLLPPHKERDHRQRIQHQPHPRQHIRRRSAQPKPTLQPPGPHLRAASTVVQRLQQQQVPPDRHVQRPHPLLRLGPDRHHLFRRRLGLRIPQRRVRQPPHDHLQRRIQMIHQPRLLERVERVLPPVPLVKPRQHRVEVVLRHQQHLRVRVVRVVLPDPRRHLQPHRRLPAPLLAEHHRRARTAKIAQHPLKLRVVRRQARRLLRQRQRRPALPVHPRKHPVRAGLLALERVLHEIPVVEKLLQRHAISKPPDPPPSTLSDPPDAQASASASPPPRPASPCPSPPR